MTDVLITNGDLQIAGGDFAVGESINQEVEHILKCHRGQWRQWPFIGAGLSQWVNAPGDFAALRREVMKALAYDNLGEARISVVKSEIVITATR